MPADSPAPPEAMRRLLAMPRETLFEHAREYFRRGEGTEPMVALVEVDGAVAVLKDYGAVPGWFARLLGPLLIAREAQALERLSGVSGVPTLYRRLDGRGLLMEFVPARPWSKVRPPAQAFAELAALLDTVHARGVAHCDLRAPSNILVDDDGRPYLVDFVARVCRGRAWNLPWNWIFAAFCRADRNALAKLKVRYAPDLATADEHRRAVHRGVLARASRAIGMGVRSFTRLFVRTPHR